MLEWELAKLLEGTSDAAFTVDLQGEIRTWNKSAEKLFGYPASFALVKSCATLVAGRTATNLQICREQCDILECARQGADISNFNMRICTNSEQRPWVNVSILVAFDRRRKHHLAVHFARDISKRKTAEDLTRKVLRIARNLVNSAEEMGELPPITPLTDREKKILTLLTEGKNSEEVANQLEIGMRTLRNHLSHINQKLHTRSRLEAVLQALKRRLI